MTAFDWIVLLILAASLVLGLLRGLVAEVFSLASWIVAFFAAKFGAAAVAAMLPMDVESEGMRNAVGFVVAFLVVLIVIMLLGRLIKGAVGAAGLGGADKAVGGVFGLLRSFLPETTPSPPEQMCFCLSAVVLAVPQASGYPRAGVDIDSWAGVEHLENIWTISDAFDSTPMPANAQVNAADAKKLATWVLSLK